MTDNTITITLDDVLGPNGLEGAWEGMVRGLVDRAESRFMHADAGKSFHAVAIAAINEAVQQRIVQRIEAAMEEPIQPTNNYGQVSGPPTTLHEMIGEAVKAAMTEKVDGQFRPDRNGRTVLSRAVEEVAGAELRLAVRNEIKNLRSEAKAAVAKEIANAISASL